jgi:PhzF family phenazine biosynthesis protein
VVDAFTDRPFAGNPAAVVSLPDWRDKVWLQSVAMEMNLSETAFLVPNAQGFGLRWFTPKVEVDLCGHATLASALVVSHLGLQAERPEIAFSTRSGILKALVQKSRIQLDFPIKPETAAEPPPGLTPHEGTRNRKAALASVLAKAAHNPTPRPPR